MPGKSNDIQLFWVDLPQDTFNGSAIGAIALLPVSSVNDSLPNEIERAVIICNIGAGWGSSTLQMHEVASSTMVTSKVKYDLPRFKGITGQINGDETPEDTVITADFMYPFFPERPISISPDWARYLNPLVQSANRSVFNYHYGIDFLNAVTNSQDLDLLEGLTDATALILANMVTNSLSRIGFWGG